MNERRKMAHMQNNEYNLNDFAIIHVRPGLEGKTQPVGTVAINLPAARLGTLVVGYAIQHSKLDSWDAARGRTVAIGRAARARDSALCAPIAKGTMRREMLISALELIVVNNESLNLSRGFREAAKDTLFRLVAAKENADLKRSTTAAE